MPKFAPNTGFRMPGLGSKEKNSASNFRDEHHVDKVGYCDNTPDEMLPSGSSPLSYKPIVDDDPYTSARYSGELAVNIPDPRPKPKVVTSPANTGSGDTNINTDNSNTDNSSTVTNNLNRVQQGKNTNREKVTTTTADKTRTTGYQGPKMSDKAWKALTPEKRRQLNAAAGADKSGKITKTTPGTTSTVFYLNGKVVDEATYNASNSSNKRKVKK